ncbi:MAG: PEP-CTERM sorting domain-containing protein [Candidatus Competibacter sp.]|nr:PEP-CTERM sorting domain-containing protein [Candidatus Competibacter sp.]
MIYNRKCLMGLAGAALALYPVFAGATVTYNTWTSNENPNGNYILTVTDIGTQFNWNLTVNPWNAEALGLFVDLGNADVPDPSGVSLTDVNPAGQVTVYATDTTSDVCGEGCNLNGLSPPLMGGDWELVFRLGAQGYDGIQTFSWTTPNFGLTESAFGVVGIRAQQLCTGTQATLPPDTNCTGSDKVYGSPGTPTTPPTGIPEPTTSALLGLGMLALGAIRRRKAT